MSNKNVLNRILNPFLLHLQICGINSEMTETYLVIYIVYCQYYENKRSKIFVFQWQLNKKSVTLTLQFVSASITKCAMFSKFHA